MLAASLLVSKGCGTTLLRAAPLPSHPQVISTVLLSLSGFSLFLLYRVVQLLVALLMRAAIATYLVRSVGRPGTSLDSGLHEGIT